MTSSTALAATIRPGDVIEFGTMTGVSRSRVADVQRLDVAITYPLEGNLRRVFPTVRVTFGAGDSLDYSPESVVTIIR
jgi:2-keto-4-pentenoate hydratase/2-oxohepta-3-ene-1,7-dioic acid hydratase in catechol pathway